MIVIFWASLLAVKLVDVGKATVYPFYILSDLFSAADSDIFWILISSISACFWKKASRVTKLSTHISIVP